MLRALTRRQPGPVLVDLGRTVLEDLPHHRLNRFGIGTGQYLGEPTSETSVRGKAVVALRNVVHVGGPQLPVTNADTDRRAGEKRSPHRSVYRLPGLRDGIGHGREPSHAPALTVQHRESYADVEYAAVPVAHCSRP